MKRLTLLLLLSSFTAISSMQMPVIFAWQQVAPAALATLTTLLTKLDKTKLNLSSFELQQLEAAQNKPSSLGKEVATKFLLGPIYHQAQLLHKVPSPNLTKPSFFLNTNIGRMDYNDAKRALWQAYEELSKGNFRQARRIIWPYMGRNRGRDGDINRLFGAFRAAEYNDYNILISLEKDQLWAALTETQKLRIAADEALRAEMNLELTLRQALLSKLRQELGLDNLNYQGLEAFLFSLMQQSPTQKLETLLSLKLADKLWPTFYSTRGILKAFYQVPYANAHSLPNNLNQTQKQSYVNRLNQLILDNQDCKNNQLFNKCATAIALATQSQPAYAHLLYARLSPHNIVSFGQEVDQIQAFLEQQKQLPKVPVPPSDDEQVRPNPNDPQHIKEVSAALAMLNDKAERLINILNQKLAAMGETLRIQTMNLYHNFHGHILGSGKPTGCHVIWQRCCFEYQKAKDWGPDCHGIYKIIRDRVSKTSSTFAADWPLDKVMDKLIEWAESGRLLPVLEESAPSIKKFNLIKSCCKDVIQLRINVANNPAELESIYSEISKLIENITEIIKCKCMN